MWKRNRNFLFVKFPENNFPDITFHLFNSENIFTIEKVKSDIRKIIFRKFNEQKITIPFPQMDLHVKSKDF